MVLKLTEAQLFLPILLFLFSVEVLLNITNVEASLKSYTPVSEITFSGYHLLKGCLKKKPQLICDSLLYSSNMLYLASYKKGRIWYKIKGLLI